MDLLAEEKRSNQLLEQAVVYYQKVIDLQNVPDDLFKAALDRCIDRMRFRGQHKKAMSVQLELIKKFPNETSYRNQLAVTFLITGRVESARQTLKEILEKWPNNGCALVHYGFILKTTDNDLLKGAYYMQKGINTGDNCTIDGRFFFHLGDAYSRLGYNEKALKLYDKGVKHKLFLSKYQRSLYNVQRLKANPWWNENDLPYKLLFEDLKKNWRKIRAEGLALLTDSGHFQDESENLKDTGDWKQFDLFSRGRKNVKHCQKTPFTCDLIDNHKEASKCRRGQTKFSVMHPGTHVWSHCGPTNCRLRVHLGLKVPPKTFLRVAQETKSWEEGKLTIFDDSFEHEVWHNGSEFRLVLIVDVWHPELTLREKPLLYGLSANNFF